MPRPTSGGTSKSSHVVEVPIPKTPKTTAAHHVSTLIRVFLLWKTFLLLIAAGSLVGPAYDTSASVIVADDEDGTCVGDVVGGLGMPPMAAFLARLSSWDAVYFLQSARRGYLFEQEWAFGRGVPIVISSVLKVLETLGLARTSSVSAALVGVAFSHVSHLLSVLALYWLGRLVWRGQTVALVAACLHVFSPAGLFLSAPYAESPFALLTFAGHLLLAKSNNNNGHTSSSSSLCGTATATLPAAAAAAVKRDALTLAAGVTFGVATAFRSNGIVNGVSFLYEFLQELWGILAMTIAAGIGTTTTRPLGSRVRRLVVLGVGGLSVTGGSVVPQYLAYVRYCSESSGLSSRRPWCDRLIPSIYTFVQVHYWDNGLLRYWTVSNLPLFLLAAPMMYILLKSGWDIISSTLDRSSTVPKPKASAAADDTPQDGCVGLVRSLAASQMLLATMVLVNSHVQIITRLSSAYPVWYWWLAGLLTSEKDAVMGRRIVVFMVIYASVQAVLFSSFLPPA